MPCVSTSVTDVQEGRFTFLAVHGMFTTSANIVSESFMAEPFFTSRFPSDHVNHCSMELVEVIHHFPY